MNEPTVGYEDEFFDHDDDHEWPDEEGSGDCYWCGGEGWDECDDPIQCTREHQIIRGDDGEYLFQICRCGSCNGSGSAKDMTIW